MFEQPTQHHSRRSEYSETLLRRKMRGSLLGHQRLLSRYTVLNKSICASHWSTEHLTYNFVTIRRSLHTTTMCWWRPTKASTSASLWQTIVGSMCTNTPCLFVHDINDIAFTLVVDDFMIKYKDKRAADHLTTTLRKLYEITADSSNVQKYVGITLNHNELNRTRDMRMLEYIQK